MSSSTTTRNPYFGIEIAIFVKIKPHVEADVREKQKKSKEESGLRDYWREWDFDLENKRGGDFHLAKKRKQRQRVADAIKASIRRALGRDHGWACVSDESVKEWQLNGPNPVDARKWCKFGRRPAAPDTPLDTSCP